MYKKSLAICIGAILLLICVFTGCQTNGKQNAILENVSECVSSFPSLPSPYLSSVCYYKDDAAEYIMAQSGGTQISGTRLSDGTTVYECCGKYWNVTERGQLVETDPNDNYKNIAIDVILQQYWNADGAQYAYHRANSPVLPLGVVPQDENYLQIYRDDFPEYIETAVFFEDASMRYIRWSIYGDGIAKLYLFAADYAIAGDLNIPGWGEVPDELIVQSFIP